jgi:hypothetical protein
MGELEKTMAGGQFDGGVGALCPVNVLHPLTNSRSDGTVWTLADESWNLHVRRLTFPLYEYLYGVPGTGTGTGRAIILTEYSG